MGSLSTGQRTSSSDWDSLPSTRYLVPMCLSSSWSSSSSSSSTSTLLYLRPRTAQQRRSPHGSENRELVLETNPVISSCSLLLIGNILSRRLRLAEKRPRLYIKDLL